MFVVLIVIFGCGFTIFMFKSFDLGNKLGEDGAKYIADVLKVNTTLSNLEIGCESFFVFFL